MRSISSWNRLRTLSERSICWKVTLTSSRCTSIRLITRIKGLSRCLSVNGMNETMSTLVWRSHIETSKASLIEYRISFKRVKWGREALQEAGTSLNKWMTHERKQLKLRNFSKSVSISKEAHHGVKPKKRRLLSLTMRMRTPILSLRNSNLKTPSKPTGNSDKKPTVPNLWISTALITLMEILHFHHRWLSQKLIEDIDPRVLWVKAERRRKTKRGLEKVQLIIWCLMELPLGE